MASGKATRVAQASVIVLSMALAACGGGSGGGVASTPPPAAPVTYTKLADMSGDRTFQTAGVQYAIGNVAGFTNGSAQALGTGVTVAYMAASDSYRLTAPDGTVATFSPSDVSAPNPSLPTSLQWSKVSGTTRDSLTLTAAVTLSYTLVGSWIRTDMTTNQSTVRLAVGGVPTVASDMPRTGTATYAVQVGGAAAQSGTSYSLSGTSSATFSADFAANSVSTALTLGAMQAGAPISFGTFNGTGAISSTGPGFTGTLNGSNGVTGVFAGAFFGPKAAEVGYDWFMSGPSFSAVGTAAGAK